MEYFLDILGLLISGKYSSPSTAEPPEAPALTSSGIRGDEDEKEKGHNVYALIIHRPAGMILSLLSLSLFPNEPFSLY